LYLYVRANPLNDSLDDNGVFSVPEGPVKIHDVKPLGALPDETFRHGDGILVVHRCMREVALAQPDDAARANVDGGVEFEQRG
jgi:hypothetical protein